MQKVQQRPEYYKLIVKSETGYTRKLRKMDSLLDRREINNASIIMLKTKKRQIDYTDKITSIHDYESSVHYGPEYPKANVIEMKEYHPVENAIKNI